MKSNTNLLMELTGRSADECDSLLTLLRLNDQARRLAFQLHEVEQKMEATEAEIQSAFRTHTKK